MRKNGEFVPPLALLEAVTAAGDLNFAFEIIGDAARAREEWVTMIEDGTLFRPITDDPRWQSFKPIVAAVITSAARTDFGLERSEKNVNQPRQSATSR